MESGMIHRFPQITRFFRDFSRGSVMNPRVALLLAIESSCDETAIAIIRGSEGGAALVLASEISSQIELHREHGGVVPELASRRRRSQ